MAICAPLNVLTSGKDRPTGVHQVSCEEVACQRLFSWDKTGLFTGCVPHQRRQEQGSLELKG